MKKNYLLLVFCFVLFSQFCQAQCTPDPQYTSPGVYPEDLNPVCTSSPYTQVFTVVVPVDTFVTSPFPMTIPIDSISLVTLLGLPPGFTYVCSPASCGFPGGTSGCVVLSGTTPAAPGSYIIRSVTNSYVHVFGSPVVQTDTSLMDTLVILGGPAVSVSTVAAGCGQSNGNATAVAADPYSPYAYSWSTGATGTPSIIALAAGNYSVTVTNSLGCVTNHPFSVSNSTGPSVALAPTSVNCNGGNNGSITATATGGTAPYAYTWSNGQVGAMTSNLTAGAYSVTVTDASGCVTVQSGNVTEPTALTASATPTAANCFGGNGNILAMGSGGTSPYTYSWSNGNTTQNLTAPAGSYSVTVTDSKGCTTTQTGTITTPSQLVITTSATGSTGSNGTATATVTGGTSPYTYSWGMVPPQFTATAITLASGNYTVFVTDAKGCTLSSTVTVVDIVSIEGLALGVSHFQVYPNPGNGIFMIEALMAAPENLSLQLEDMKGSVLYTSKHPKASELHLPVDFSMLAKGIYLLSLSTDKGSVHLKLMVQ